MGRNGKLNEWKKKWRKSTTITARNEAQTDAVRRLRRETPRAARGQDKVGKVYAVTAAAAAASLMLKLFVVFGPNKTPA